MEGTLGQIMLFAANWAPRNWALCEGQLLAIAQNQALFSILGTIYGGDGRTTFALPDLRGRVPVGQGSGPGLTNRSLGQKMGSETNILNSTQMPPHTHSLAGGTVTVPISASEADQVEGSGNFLANGTFYHNSAEAVYGNGPLPLSGNSGSAGGGQAVNNVQPGLVGNYIICINGIFPSRS